VQVQISSGSVVFNVVGLGDKAVAESRERVRAALIASGLALPAKRITVNLLILLALSISCSKGPHFSPHSPLKRGAIRAVMTV
jgi:predicted ATPase with chaperone activity